MEPGSVSLLISDGPYGMGKAAWDRMKPRDLPEWYAPHIAAWGRLCMPSATVYLWGSDEGEGYLRAPMRATGWTRTGTITWDKGVGFMAGKIDTASMRSWYDITEVCGVYRRDGVMAPTVAHEAGADPDNWLRGWLNRERERAGIPLERLKELITEAGGFGEMLVRHTFYESQWWMPTREQWEVLRGVWNEHGDTAGRPYLDLAHEIGVGLFEDLKARHAHLRDEYEALRAPFEHPMGMGNVWRHGQVTGQERLSSEAGDALHPCQKPLAFYDRMIRASSRPGDLVCEPFGGTLRAAVAIERMEASEARRYVCIEPDEDGRDYIAAVLRSLRLDPDTSAERQPSLFAERT